MGAAIRQIPAWLHKGIISSIESAPALNVELYRAFNGALRLIGGTYRSETYFKSTMICDPRDFLQQRVLHFGVWEPNTSAVIEKLLGPGDIFVDIGANVGYDTLLASHLVGPRGIVIGIEASPSTFELLSENLRANDATNVRLVNKAVSDVRGYVDLYGAPTGNRGRTTILASSGFQLEATVEALPLDEILTVEERAGLRLIKMDIEGAELPVMRRFLETIELYPDFPRLLVEVSPVEAPPEAWLDIFERMRSVWYAAYLIENDYSKEWYLKHRHQLTPLQPVNELPERRSDILFTRGQAPIIAS
jgi:FkbM family methyltransferase